MTDSPTAIARGASGVLCPLEQAIHKGGPKATVPRNTTVILTSLCRNTLSQSA
jgi:hypothetical protein